MTPFDRFSFSRKIAERELVQFKRLLDSHSSTPLRERDHILPFFRSHRHLAALIGTRNSTSPGWIGSPSSSISSATTRPSS
jgi:hypothetical protein